jgi:ubiquinone biosynthesis protein
MQQWLRGSAGESIADLSTPVRIRLALSELGTTFIKFGQMLSTRPDLVGQDVAAELTHLQSQTPPDPAGAAEATIQTELGSSPTTVFASFEPTPFASASIAQVTTRVCTAARTSSSRSRRTASRVVSKPT